MTIQKLRPTFTFTEDRLRELQQVVPEAFADGRINWEVLREALGEYLEDETQEHFGLTWPGKREARRLAALPPQGTLVPAPGEGVDEETTHNLFIEGENLEVLKLLQKSYAGRVKMIYIDPPYNTGNDFIYEDDYSEPLEAYLKRTGQMDEAGRRLTTNTRASGRFHSKWLSMIYPRLLLARQLLREDGVIFVSIDDSEAHHLRRVMDEIFGEENYLVTLYIQVRYGQKTLAEKNDFQKVMEQVLVYQKSDLFIPNKDNEEYGIDKFVWKVTEKASGQEISLGGKTVKIFKPGEYELIKVEPSIDALKETWASGSVLRVNASGKFFATYLAGRKEIDGINVLYKVYGIGDDGLGYRYFTGPKKGDTTKGKFYSGVPLNRRVEIESGSSIKYKPIINFLNLADAFGNCRLEGETDFRGGKKPLDLLSNLIKIANCQDDLILDFFAGSCTTAHAVLAQNREDGGRRQFIMVQLPEATPPDSEARKAGYATIAEIGKERIRRVIRKMKEEQNGQLPLPATEDSQPSPLDLGFKVLKLARSHFREWTPIQPTEAWTLDNLFEQHASPLVEGWTKEGLLTEILLLEGFPLDSRIIPLDGFDGNTLWRVHHEEIGHELMVCLDETIQPATVERLKSGEILRREDIFICLDSALTDEAKVVLDDRLQLKVI